MALMLALGAGNASAQNFSGVPGVVINYEESPSALEQLFNQEVYLASPSITIMPNGDYFVSHDYFGNGTNENVTGVFRSTDKGATWTQTATINGAFQSTIFQHDGALYLWGYASGGGDSIVIRKSTNNGVTWTSPTNASSGLLEAGSFGGTSNVPVIHNGRIWIAQGGVRVMSAPVGADLLLASSWTRANGPSAASVNNGPLGSGLTITEAQIVASPQTGVVIMPKIGGLPNSVLFRVNPTNPGQMLNPTNNDWVSLPGGEKKFGATYDPVTQKFYILDNPVLPAHANHPDGPALIRNTAAVLSSTDLYHWDVEKIFLYSDNPSREGFQYFNFVIDGDDLAVASRTAMVIPGQNQPPRGHDSNLITFHAIEDFRSLAPTYKLVLDTAGNRVRRFETTQFEDAPLGDFQIGASFAGAPLTQPNGLAQSATGDIYVREQTDRILRFDPLGNFIGAVGALPSGLSFTTSPLNITPPAPGDRGWVRTSAGNWSDPLNWFYWGRPDTNHEIAHFGSAISGNVTVTVDRDFTLKGMVFRDDNIYTIAGPSRLTLQADTGRAIITLEQGYHRIYADLRLDSEAELNLAANTTLEVFGDIDLRGNMLFVRGPSRPFIRGGFAMNGGRLVLDGLESFVFGETNVSTLDGTLQFLPDASLSLTAGQSFDLFDGVFTDTFDHVLLPALSTHLAWNTSSLYNNGVISIVSVPEPAVWAWLALAFSTLYRHRPHKRREARTFIGVL